MLTEHFPSPKQIAQDIAENGYHIYHNAISPETIRNIKSFWCAHFLNWRPTKELSGPNLRFGGRNFIIENKSTTRHMIRSVNFLWNPPTHPVSRNLSSAIYKKVNQAQGLPENYGFEFTPERIGIFIGTHWYPPGTGFLSAHTDDNVLLPELLFMIPITSKDSDYDGGGLFVKNLKGQKILVDDLMNPGSIVFYSAKREHGVDLITSRSPKDFGRISLYAVATFFKTRENDPPYLRTIENTHYRLKGIYKKLKRSLTGLGKS
ncbi:MAG: hypothetical protein JKY15_05465 [Deltaproteobacteria bacterium]|nr:hypothetical protein [Deltaproteobacteria bacterium]